ncbi:MAG: hypothetical protein ACPG4T_07955 [Nannocystaceae bacterium]
MKWWLRFGIAALASLPSLVYGQDAENQRRLKDVAESAKLALNELPVCEGDAPDPERASTFGTVGEVFLYVATHYGYTPGKESHILYYVKWALEAFKKSNDCNPEYENHDVSRKALWLIAWHVRWLNENHVPEDVAKVHMETLEQARKQVVVPKAPTCPSCPEAIPLVLAPLPPSPEKETGYYPRFGGRYSLGVEMGVSHSVVAIFVDQDVDSYASNGAIGVFGGVRIPKRRSSFGIGVRYNPTFIKFYKPGDEGTGVLHFMGVYANYGVGPASRVFSAHLELQAGLTVLSSAEPIATGHVAPGFQLCFAGQAVCLSYRFFTNPKRGSSTRARAGILVVGLDGFRIADRVIRNRQVHRD